MRQIRPRTTHPTLAPVPGPTPLLVDLRDQTVAAAPTEHLRAQLDRAKQAIRDVTQQLAVLIDERDALKARLDESSGPGHPVDPDDRSIVPWGFYEEEAV